MKFNNIRVYNFGNALYGMRNPKNSWHLKDTKTGICHITDLGVKVNDMMSTWLGDSYSSLGKAKRDECFSYLMPYITTYIDEENKTCEYAAIGPKDMKLATTLIKAGPEHRKFLRQIFVSVDITAPLYFWKELSTYKVGTVENSTSTMHTLTNSPITLDCFETDDYVKGGFPLDNQRCAEFHIDLDFIERDLIPYLENLRQTYLALCFAGDSEASRVWKELIRWLPESWLQTRTVTLNYETMLAICSPGQRRHHKLPEWSYNSAEDKSRESFIRMARKLPYAQDFIFADENKGLQTYFNN